MNDYKLKEPWLGFLNREQVVCGREEQRTFEHCLNLIADHWSANRYKEVLDKQQRQWSALNRKVGYAYEF